MSGVCFWHHVNAESQIHTYSDHPNRSRFNRIFGLWALGPKAETVVFEKPVEPEPIAQKEESEPAVPMATIINYR